MTDTPDDLVARIQSWSTSCDKAAFSASLESEKKEFTARAEFLRNVANRIEALESRQRVLREELERIEDNLGDYIERKGTVDVSIALTYEVARAALAGDAG